MTPLFEWLDASVARYWIVAWSFFAALIAATLAGSGQERDASNIPFSTGRRRLAHPAVFVILLVLTLAAFRWPIWFAPADVNPDEDQILAGAITLREFPVFWKYVDTGTSGPLNAYLPAIASWVGVPLNYLGVRIIATLLQTASLLGVWALLRRMAPDRVSRLAILPGLCFWAFSSFHDFVQYSSEHLSIALTTGAALAGTYALEQKKSSGRRIVAFAMCGLLAGMTPFAKLQLVPLAFYVVICVALAAWWREGLTRPLVRQWLALGVGGVAFPALVAVCIEIYGLWGQFNLSYIQTNLQYMKTGDSSFGDQPGQFLAFAAGTPGTGLLIGGSLATALLLTWPTLTGASRNRRLWSLVTWLGLAVAFFCVARPGRDLPHYLQIAIIPCCLLVGVHLAGVWNTAPATAKDRPISTWLTVLALTLTVAPPVFFRAMQGHLYAGRLAENRSLSSSPEGRFLNEYKRAGDTLTIWGWLPRLHVETQLPQGTRDCISERQISESPLRPLFQGLYMRDLSRRAPTWFIDSVGPHSFAYHDRLAQGYETFPALAALIETDYVFVAEINDVRIFRHRKAPPLQGVADQPTY